MSIPLHIEEELVHFFPHKVTRAEAIGQLCSLLEDRGYVEPSFCAAVLEREKVFPTGLPTEPVGVAIPHTDSVHVRRGAFAVGVLASPVEFMEMGADDSLVQVSLILVLAVDEKSAMADILQKLATEFHEREFLLGLANSASAAEVVVTLRSKLL